MIHGDTGWFCWRRSRGDILRRQSGHLIKFGKMLGVPRGTAKCVAKKGTIRECSLMLGNWNVACRCVPVPRSLPPPFACSTTWPAATPGNGFLPIFAFSSFSLTALLFRLRGATDLLFMGIIVDVDCHARLRYSARCFFLSSHVASRLFALRAEL